MGNVVVIVVIAAAAAAAAVDVDVDVDAATNATAVAVTAAAVAGQTTGLNQFDGAWKLKLLLLRSRPARQVRHRAREMAPLDVPRALLDGEKVVKWDDVSTVILKRILNTIDKNIVSAIT